MASFTDSRLNYQQFQRQRHFTGFLYDQERGGPVVKILVKYKKETKNVVTKKCLWPIWSGTGKWYRDGIEEAVEDVNRTMNSVVGDASGKSGRLFLHYTPYHHHVVIFTPTSFMAPRKRAQKWTDPTEFCHKM